MPLADEILVTRTFLDDKQGQLNEFEPLSWAGHWAGHSWASAGNWRIQEFNGFHPSTCSISQLIFFHDFPMSMPMDRGFPGFPAGQAASG